MKENILNLSNDCRLAEYIFSENCKDVCLEYIEHSTDHYHSDTDTEILIDIDKDKAIQIIEFLTKGFNL